MSLDGLRAWIGEVERKLGMRTRVFVVLATITIGGAAAAIYLAVDAQDNSVSESDVQALQEKLETRIDQASEATGAGGQVAKLETELKLLRAQIEALQGGSGAAGSGGESQSLPGGTTGSGEPPQSVPGGTTETNEQPPSDAAGSNEPPQAPPSGTQGSSEKTQPPPSTTPTK